MNCHLGAISRPFGTYPPSTFNPTLKRWAILRWSLRDMVYTAAVWLFMGLGLPLLCLAVAAAEIAEKAKPQKEPITNDIFAGTNVLRIRILIPNSGLSALRNTGWGNGQERPRVKAIVREGGRVYTNVEVHLKGAAGSFRPVDDNPGLTLDFEKNAPGQ